MEKIHFFVSLLFSILAIFPLSEKEIVSTLDYTYTSKSSILLDDFLYECGYERDIYTNDVNGVFIKKNRDVDKEEFRIRYDIGYDEVFLYMGMVTDNTIAIISRNTLTYSVYRIDEFVSTQILLYSLDGFLVNRITIDEDFSSYGNINYKLILLSSAGKRIFNDQLIEIDNVLEYSNYSYFSLQYLGSSYLNDELVDEIVLEEPGNYHIKIIDDHFLFEEDIVITPTIIGVLDGGIYNDSIEIMANGNLLLNEEIVISPFTIDEPGEYELKVEGIDGYTFSLHFLYLFRYEGIEENEETVESVTIQSDAISMLLNDVPYFSELITDVGSYTLTLLGQGGYTEEVHFKILPSIIGVTNYSEYDGDVHIMIRGEAYLNGDIMSDEAYLSDPGSYLIELYFEGELYQQCYFSILDNENEVVDNPSNSSANTVYQILLGGLVLMGIILIVKKK